MKLEKPQFKLARVADADAHDAAEIVSVQPTYADAQMDRRNFLATGISAAAVLLFLGYESTQAMPLMRAINSSQKIPVEGVTFLGITPDGKNLISVSDSRMVDLWSLPEGQLLHSRLADKSLSEAQVIKSPGQGHPDATHTEARHFMLLSLSKEFVPPGLRKKIAGQEISAMTATPDGSMLACASGNNIHVWSIADDRPVATRLVEEGDVELLALSSNGETLAAATSDGTILMWALDEHESSNGVERDGSSGWINALVIPPDEQLFETAEGGVAIADATSTSKREVPGVKSHPMATLQALALTPDGETLSAGYSNGVILIWNPAQSQRHKKKRGTTRVGRRGRPIHIRGRSGGRTWTEPCVPTPIPPGTICTCNCVRMD
jgi:WD40 repeat protein